jgi:hypothetical protein
MVSVVVMVAAVVTVLSKRVMFSDDSVVLRRAVQDVKAATASIRIKIFFILFGFYFQIYLYLLT